MSEKITNQYDDDYKHNYLDYWKGREYENESEAIVLRSILKGKKFKHAIDVGGGFGRISKLLSEYAEKVSLVEPSKQQLEIAKDFLQKIDNVESVLSGAHKMPFEDGSVDLALVFRVIHHLPDPSEEFAEIARVLKKDGTFIIEFANSTHFKNRIEFGLKGKRISREPIDISSPGADIPFVNHHPKTVQKLLAHNGFELVNKYSVSNLRMPIFKKVLPRGIMLSLERIMQRPFSFVNFGPSVVYVLRKKF